MATHYPLRTAFGDVLRVGTLEVRSEGFPADAVSVISCASMQQALSIDHTAWFPDLQSPASGTVLARPAPGLGRIPGQIFAGDYDFPAGSYLVIRADPRAVEQPVEDGAWIELRLSLGRTAVIGGIGLVGHPYLPRPVEANGYDRANFGLPREIAVSPVDPRYARFVDAEPRFTQQIAHGHGGLSFLNLPHQRTGMLAIRLRDLPQLAIGIEPVSGKTTTGTGLLVAALFVYEARQGVRHRSLAAAGLTACLVGDPDRSIATPPGSSAPSQPVAQSGLDSGWAAFFHGSDLVEPRGAGRRGQTHYLMHSAGSVAGPERLLGGWSEQFRTPPLHAGEAVALIVTQGEEHPRSIAAVRLDLPRQRRGMGPRPHLTVEVYAIDPAPGEPRVQWRDSPAGIDSHVLVGRAGIERSARAALIRLRAPSTAESFLVRIVNDGRDGDSFVLTGLTLMRSASQVVGPRSSRRQRVERLHYRITGPGLADDYGRIGAGAARIGVALETGRGGSANVLEATSLLELVQGGARVLANQRYWHFTKVVHEERTVTHAQNEVREAGTAREGWRGSELGEGVVWPAGDRPVAPGASAAPPGGFHSYGSTETRTHTELVGHETAAHGLREVMALLDQIGLSAQQLNLRQVLDADGDGLIDGLPPRLREDVDDHPVSWEDVWGAMAGVDYVGVVEQLALPPYVHALANTSQVGEALTRLAQLPGGLQGYLEDPLGAAAELGEEVAPIIGFLTLLASSALANLSFSLGGQLIGGVSVSATSGLALPQLSYGSSEGTTGAIHKQGNRSIHSRSRSLETGYDHTRTRSRVTEGNSRRTVTTERDDAASRRERRRGTEVRWQEREVDIVTGTVALGLDLPSTRDEVYATLDQLVRVRIDCDPEDDVDIDVWFEVSEQIVEEED